MPQNLQLSITEVKAIRTTVEKNSASIRGMGASPEKELSSRRYIQLVRDLLEEAGGKHGAKKAIADQLHVSADYIGKLLSGERTTVGVEAIERAIKHMGLSRDYFYKHPRQRLHFREWQLPTGDAVHPVFREWLAKKPRGLSFEEYEALASIPFAEPKSWKYDMILDMMRGRTEQPDEQADAEDRDDGSGIRRRRGRSSA